MISLFVCWFWNIDWFDSSDRLDWLYWLYWLIVLIVLIDCTDRIDWLYWLYWLITAAQRRFIKRRIRTYDSCTHCAFRYLLNLELSSRNSFTHERKFEVDITIIIIIIILSTLSLSISQHPLPILHNRIEAVIRTNRGSCKNWNSPSNLFQNTPNHIASGIIDDGF